MESPISCKRHQRLMLHKRWMHNSPCHRRRLKSSSHRHHATFWANAHVQFQRHEHILSYLCNKLDDFYVTPGNRSSFRCKAFPHWIRPPLQLLEIRNALETFTISTTIQEERREKKLTIVRDIPRIETIFNFFLDQCCIRNIAHRSNAKYSAKNISCNLHKIEQRKSF